MLRSLAGVEPGLLELLWLERSGGRILNRPRALLLAHDKLRTAACLRHAGIRHPETRHLRVPDADAVPRAPVVIKPRFGSWGADVRLCETPHDVRECLDEFRSRLWFRRHGALVQEVIPSAGRDLRLIVAGGRVVGAAERVAAPGEWRTNVSVGATKRSVDPDPDVRALAVHAAAALGADLVGVDVLPLPDEGYVVIELNGAVDFELDYTLGRRDVYEEAARALGLVGPAVPALRTSS